MDTLGIDTQRSVKFEPDGVHPSIKQPVQLEIDRGSRTDVHDLVGRQQHTSGDQQQNQPYRVLPRA